jgi:hypothetical protein
MRKTMTISGIVLVIVWLWNVKAPCPTFHVPLSLRPIVLL